MTLEWSLKLLNAKTHTQTRHRMHFASNNYMKLDQQNMFEPLKYMKACANNRERSFCKNLLKLMMAFGSVHNILLILSCTTYK